MAIQIKNKVAEIFYKKEVVKIKLIYKESNNNLHQSFVKNAFTFFNS